MSRLLVHCTFSDVGASIFPPVSPPRNFPVFCTSSNPLCPDAYDRLDRPVKSPDGRGHQWDIVFDTHGNPPTVGLTVNGSYLDGYYAKHRVD